MGVTIFFSGRLRTMADLPRIVAAAQQKARQLDWPYETIDERIVGIGERLVSEDVDAEDGIPTTIAHVVEEPLDNHWKGIVIHPPQCESLFLTFNRQGRLIQYGAASSAGDIGHYGINDTLWCKTQFGSTQAHVAICELLRLVGRYAAEWKVIDEGGYYESGNLADLEARRGLINAALQMLADEVKKGDQEHAKEPEIGKVIGVESPAWRKTWGDEHSENSPARECPIS